MYKRKLVHLSTNLLQNYVLWLKVSVSDLIFMEILDTST